MIIEKVKGLNLITKILFGLSLLLISYGIVCQLVPINFFWESFYLGVLFFIISLISLFIDKIKKNKALNEDSTGYKIGTGVASFILLMSIIMTFSMPQTDAYEAAKEYVLLNEDLKSKLGNIQSFGLVPMGSISIQTDSNGKAGSAQVHLIVKGDKAYKKLVLFVFKDYGKEWEVFEFQ